jgi:RND family efflux transporter MFP subunit
MKNILSSHEKLSGLLFIVFLIIPLATGAQEEKSLLAKNNLFTVKAAMREVVLTGYTRARYEMDIVSEEAGRCVKVTTDVGDTVGKDGVFAVLDTTFIDLSIKKNLVDQKKMKNQLAYWAKDVIRYEDLVGRNAAAQSKLDEYRHKRDQVRFQLETMKVEERNLKERRERFTIRVPTGWKIMERRVEPGEWVAVGHNLGKAGDFRTLLVPFSLAPLEYKWLREHKNPIPLFLPDEGESGIEVQAVVERISPDFDPQTRKTGVDLAIREGLSERRGGIRAQLNLMLPDPSGAVLVPRSAMERRYEEFWLTRPNGEHVNVVFLGEGPGDTHRVRSPKVKPGDQFRLP